MHLLNLPVKGANPFPAITLPESHVASWVEELIASCNFHCQYEADKWLLSHRDIHASNIIWRDDKNPHLIDWESAGLIHPAIELVGLAVNCAGLALCWFAEERYHATLMGYGQCAGKLPKIDTRLWNLTLQTWLLWFAHCLRQGWRDDAEHTLQVIVLIRDKMARMQQIYAKVYSLFQ